MAKHPAAEKAARDIMRNTADYYGGDPMLEGDCDWLPQRIQAAIDEATEKNQLQIRVLVTALKALKRNGCWCDPDLEQPMTDEHCLACQFARQVVDQAALALFRGEGNDPQ